MKRCNNIDDIDLRVDIVLGPNVPHDLEPPLENAESLFNDDTELRIP